MSSIDDLEDFESMTVTTPAPETVKEPKVKSVTAMKKLAEAGIPLPKGDVLYDERVTRTASDTKMYACKENISLEVLKLNPNVKVKVKRDLLIRLYNELNSQGYTEEGYAITFRYIEEKDPHTMSLSVTITARIVTEPFMK